MRSVFTVSMNRIIAFILKYLTASASRSVHVLHNSEQPTSCFSVLDNGACLVADLQFDILMQKMKSFYQCRKNIRVEVRGQRHVLGDFIIKVGSVIVGQMTSFKGILVEVISFFIWGSCILRSFNLM